MPTDITNLRESLCFKFLEDSFSDETLKVYNTNYTELSTLIHKISTLNSEYENSVHRAYYKLLALNFAGALHKHRNKILTKYDSKDETIFYEIANQIQKRRLQISQSKSFLLILYKTNLIDFPQVNIINEEEHEKLQYQFGLIRDSSNSNHYFKTDITESNCAPLFIGKIQLSCNTITITECAFDVDSSTQVFYRIITGKEPIFPDVDQIENGYRWVQKNKPVSDYITLPSQRGISYVKIEQYEGIKKVPKLLKYRLRIDLENPGRYCLEYTPTSSQLRISIYTMPLIDNFFKLTLNNGAVFGTFGSRDALFVLLALNVKLDYVNKNQLDASYFNLYLMNKLAVTSHVDFKTLLPKKSVTIMNCNGIPYLAIQLDQKKTKDIFKSFLPTYSWGYIRLELHQGAFAITTEQYDCDCCSEEDCEKMAELYNGPQWSSARILEFKIPLRTLTELNEVAVVPCEKTTCECSPSIDSFPLKNVCPDYGSVAIFDYKYPQTESIFLDAKENNLSLEEHFVSQEDGVMKSIMCIKDSEESQQKSYNRANQEIWCRFFYSEKIKELLPPNFTTALDYPNGRNVIAYVYDRTNPTAFKNVASIKRVSITIVQPYYVAHSNSPMEDFECDGVVIALDRKTIQDAKKENCDTICFEFVDGFICGTSIENKHLVSKSFTIHFDLNNGLPVRTNTITLHPNTDLKEKQLTFGVSPYTSVKLIKSIPSRIIFELSLVGMPGVTLNFQKISKDNFDVCYEHPCCTHTTHLKITNLKITPYPGDSFRNPQVNKKDITMTYRFSMEILRPEGEFVAAGKLLFTIPESTVILTQEQLVNPTGIPDIDFRRYYINSQTICL